MVEQARLLKALMVLGLKEVDAEIYVLLAKEGPQKGKDIAETLNVYRQRVYRSLDRLQRKCCVKATLERPSRFSAVALEEVIDVLVEANLEEAREMEQNRQSILSHWQTMTKKTMSGKL